MMFVSCSFAEPVISVIPRMTSANIGDIVTFDYIITGIDEYEYLSADFEIQVSEGEWQMGGNDQIRLTKLQGSFEYEIKYGYAFCAKIDIHDSIIFASNQNTSKNLFNSDIASSITKIGEAYAVFANSPCLHFYSAKANVRETVKAYNQQAVNYIRQQSAAYLSQRNLQVKFEQLDPYQFEEYVAKRMRDCGYSKVQVTPKSGDYGADVLGVDPNGRPVCVQCKMYTGKVGFDAVQQINTAKTLFNCERAILATTSTLTQQAKEAARKLQVEVYENFNAGTVIR